MTTATPDFDALRDTVAGLTGLDLGAYRRRQLERRVRAFAERRGTSDLSQYARRLREDRGELERFLDRLTINVSQLWRNPEQWELLGRDLLPELAADGPVRAWSAGCSYGAEAYTLAAVCREARVPAGILGTDVDARMIERARQGWFSADDARDAPAATLRRWFAAAREGGWQAAPELALDVRFEVADLLRQRPAAGSFDLVLCRNTVIYFTEDARDALHARLAAALRPGGVLLVGATERVSDPARLGLRALRPFVYRRVGA